MTIREDREAIERKILSKKASFSEDSKSRLLDEEECNIRTSFQRDRDRILHSKSFRRLKHKTQVFIAPEGDHYRTRLTHTLEVAQISRTIARALRLNEDLVEAISLGHDLGHTPFGHSGERVLNTLNPKGYSHNEQSLRVVDLLENKNGRRGLNLTLEVRDGILKHSGKDRPMTLEGEIVKIADRIAYINHDIDDALRAGLIEVEDLASDSLAVLGKKSSERINIMIFDVIENSIDQDSIEMSEKVGYYMNDLRKFLFENVYFHRRALGQEKKVDFIISELYSYYKENLSSLPRFYYDLLEDYDKDTVVTDYIAGMTDVYIVSKFKDIFIPDSWEIR